MAWVGGFKVGRAAAAFQADRIKGAQIRIRVQYELPGKTEYPGPDDVYTLVRSFFISFLCV